MALLAAAKLTDEMLRLVWRSGLSAALDLQARHVEVHGWFAGMPVYQAMRAPTYPPAAYATLWPLLGWMPFEGARWLWAVTTVAALAWLTWLVVRESGATGAWHRAAVALLLLAMNQTGVAIGNGQLILHVLPPLVVGLLLIHNGRGSWPEDLAASAAVIFAMMKVSLTAPFLWLVLFAPASGKENRTWPCRARPALLVAAGYTLLTFFAASFQDGSVLQQLREWMDIARIVSERGGDYANLSAWLNDAGLARLFPPVSLVVFVALGVWLQRYRRADLWVRLGVVAIVTRFWAYHRLYDDVLIVLAFVALCRIVTSVAGKTNPVIESSSPGASERVAHVRVVATALIATSMLFMLLPARLGTSGAPWRQIFTVSHTVTWLGVLAFLGWYAARADTTRRGFAVAQAVHSRIPPTTRPSSVPHSRN